MIAIASLSQWIILDPDEILSDYARSLPRDLINLESITNYLNFVDKYKSGKRSQMESLTPPELILDPELQ